MNRGTVFLDFDGLSQEGAERIRLIIVELFKAGVFAVKSGSATIHFDHEGTLQEISTNVKRYRRMKT